VKLKFTDQIFIYVGKLITIIAFFYYKPNIEVNTILEMCLVSLILKVLEFF